LLANKLQLAGVDFDFHRYEAKHAFANPHSTTRGLPPLEYNPQAAELAWDRTFVFLKASLEV
jgi:carboxymethylenebutenolidase